MGIMTRFFHNRGVAPNSRLETAAQSAAQPSRSAAICSSEGRMIQGLQMLCGVVLLAVITVGQTWGAEAIDIRLQSGTPLEERGRDQLRRLLRTYDLHKWLFTRDVLIQSGVIPHSHPVLTLNTRYVDDDTAQLATFVHEQLHWFLTDHVERASAHRVACPLPHGPDRSLKEPWGRGARIFI